ncbi:hypothetical protein [Dactylosporangium sp. CA-233914]|uniref:hypothetical protein n=1 Tax=Dactylosporangium sp. CA-233914 TaxID=3239934 RepID=UPI003D8B0153
MDRSRLLTRTLLAAGGGLPVLVAAAWTQAHALPQHLMLLTPLTRLWWTSACLAAGLALLAWGAWRALGGGTGARVLAVLAGVFAGLLLPAGVALGAIQDVLDHRPPFEAAVAPDGRHALYGHAVDDSYDEVCYRLRTTGPLAREARDCIARLARREEIGFADATHVRAGGETIAFHGLSRGR